MKIEEIDKTIYNKTAQFRLKIFKPILRLLVFLKITPNMISYLGVIFMLFFVYFINKDPIISTYLLILTIFIDMFDGSLARYLKMDSDKGKFTDMLCDNFNFTLFIVGMVYIQIINSLVGLLYVYFMLLVVILMIVKKNILEASNWLIHARAGFFPHFCRAATYTLFFIWIIWGIDLLNLSSIIFIVLLTIKAIMDYWDIKNKIITKKRILTNKFLGRKYIIKKKK